MAKMCFVCGKSKMAGRSIQHKHAGGWMYKAPKSNRVFKPNLRNVDIEVEGELMSVPVCMKCYKKMKKDS